MRRAWTIYALVDPRDGTKRYVGRTTNLAARLSGHRTTWRGNGVKPGKALSLWLSDLYASGSWPFRVVVLQETRSFGGARRAESKWIRKGMVAGWPLVNAHSGAAGGAPEDIRERLARIRRAKWEAERRAREEAQARWERTFELAVELYPEELEAVRAEAERRGDEIHSVLHELLERGLQALTAEHKKAVAA